MDAPRLAPGVVYLDYMGAALYSERQITDALRSLSSVRFGNPHSAHPLAAVAHDEIAAVRELVLNFFGGTAEYSVVFTSSCTAALQLLAHSLPFGPAEASPPDGDVVASLSVHVASHNSVIGIREVAVAAGAEYLRPFATPAEYASILRQSRSGSRNGRQRHFAVFPAECNFSGTRYPVSDWSRQLHAAAIGGERGPAEDGEEHLPPASQSLPRVFVCVDGAAAAGKAPIHLDGSGVDFFALSFYKMFGFPTGVGALLVRNVVGEFAFSRRQYFGGGSVEYVLPSTAGAHKLRGAELPQRLEDGTPNFQLIHALRFGLEAIERRGGVEAVAGRIAALRGACVEQLRALRHHNGAPVVRIHGDDSTVGCGSGSSIALTVLTPSGSPVGHSIVEQLAAANLIMLRAGCFCNPGACQRYLGISDRDVLRFARAGHVCWDEHDLIDGQPTGCVRISLGMYTAPADVSRFVKFISTSFVWKFEIPAMNSHGVASPRHGCSATAQDRARLPPPTAVRPPASPLHHQGCHTIKHIAVFPVKGVFGFAPAAWPVTPRGLLFDREWMIVSARDGTAITPKRNTRMTALRATLDLEENVLLLTCTAAGGRGGRSPLRILLDELSLGGARSHGGGSVERCVPAGHTPQQKQAVVHGRRLGEYRTYSARVDAWVSEALGVGARLLRRSARSSFKNSGDAAFLVVSWHSHSTVVRATPSNERKFISWMSYRPNIVLISSGASPEGGGAASDTNGIDVGDSPFPPFEELQWDSLHVFDEAPGNPVLVLQSCGICPRCTQLGVQSDGSISHQPLATVSRLCEAFGVAPAAFGTLFDVSAISPAPAARPPRPVRSSSRWALWARGHCPNPFSSLLSAALHGLFAAVAGRVLYPRVEEGSLKIAIVVVCLVWLSLCCFAHWWLPRVGVVRRSQKEALLDFVDAGSPSEPRALLCLGMRVVPGAPRGS